METNQAQGERFILMLNSVMNIEKLDPMRPLLPPERLWLGIDAVNHALKIILKLIFKAEKVRVICSSEKFSGVRITCLDHSITAKEPLSQLRQFIEHFKGNVLFSVETEGRRETLLDLLSPLKIKPKQIKTLSGSQSRQV